MYYIKDVSDLYVKIYYRNFALKDPGVCHQGLGVNGTHTVKVLHKHKIRAELIPVWDTTGKDIEADLNKSVGVTHAIIEAPYIDSHSMRILIKKFPNVCFTCRIHSQVGFLQVEAGAVKLIREYIHIQEQEFNFLLSCNNERLCLFIEQAYHGRCLLLPNLYFIDPISLPLHKTNKSVINVGSFGAIRLQKNHSTSAAAALILAKMYNFELNFYMSVNREEHGKGVLQAIKNMFDEVTYAKFIEVPWKPWSQFKHHVRFLDIHFQLSMSETFNITVADAVTCGIPSVVGHSIEWVPDNWKVNIDDAYKAADVAYKLFIDPYAAQRGLNSLKKYVDNSYDLWYSFLIGEPRQNNHLEKIS